MTSLIKYIVLINRQPHKMVKHNQTISRLLSTNCLSVFDHCVRLALNVLTHDSCPLNVK